MPIGIYIRVSTLDQKDNYSFIQQEIDGISYAQNIEQPYKIYKEAASGRKKSREEREVFDKLWKDVESGKIKTVWIGKADRFTRDTALGLQFINTMQQTNCHFVIGSKEYNLLDPNDYFILTMLFGIAKLGGDNIVKSGREGLKTMKDKGEYRYPKLFGYRWVLPKNAKLNKHGIPQKSWIVDKDEAKCIKLIYKLFFKGYSFYRITNEINAMGIPSRYGKNWTYSQVCRLLKKPQYCGWQYDSNKELIESKVYKTPIVTKDEFLRVQELWHTVRITQAKTFKYSDWMCASIVRCAYCNAPFIHKYNKREYGKEVYSWYVAKHRSNCQKPKGRKGSLSIDASTLDHFFSHLYILAMANPDFLEFVFKSIKEKLEEEKEFLTDEERLAKEKVEEKTNEKRNLLLMISKRGYDAMNESLLNEVEDQMKIANNRLREASLSIDILRTQVEEIRGQFMFDNISRFQESPNSLKRKMLESIIDHVYFKERWLHIALIGGVSFIWDIDHPFDGGKILELIERSYKIRDQSADTTVICPRTQFYDPNQ